MSDCIFCRIASGEIPATVVARNDHALAFRDLNPQAPVHVLVIPKRHFDAAEDAVGGDGITDFVETLKLAVTVAGDLGLVDNGYRLVVNHGPDGGQSVYHLHVHLLGGRKLSWPPG
ncbi:MAG: histidine triad nucleotide-binding protein [Gemmatimonadales bacterium]